LAARRGISYDSRRLDPDGQSFVFRAEAAGTYALKFYKQDFIRDFILNDHVQVIIGEAPEVSATGFFNPAADRSRVIAEPRWPSPAEEAEAFRRSGNPAASAPAAGVSPSGPVPGNAQRPGIVDEGIVPVRPPEVSAGGMDGGAVPAMPVQPAVPDTLPAPPSIPFAQYLQQAQEEFDAGRVAAAIGVLDKFREGYPSGSDEAYWLYGQFYEANSPSRDIRLSLDYYRRLVREYPQSKRYNEARRRIAYLERYYINIQ
jgi:TolA-binding protein